MEKGHSTYYKEVLKKYFSKEELKELHAYSDWRALWEVVYTWLWISFAFALVYFFPNVFTVVLALFIIGGKQLACAIIMHDTGHNSLFKSAKLNHFFGNFFGAYPIFMNMPAYGKYHLQHHLHTGLEDDPDTNLTKGYPASKSSMTRKLLRDLLGLTGLKGFVGLLLMHAGYIQFELGGRVVKLDQSGMTIFKRIRLFIKNFSGPLFSNLVIFLVCFALAKPLLYLLWIGAFFTTFYFCIRIRAITEHSVVPDERNPLLNTRTTQANFVEKLLFAPLNVNYHVEHHLIMSVPCYLLPKMHKMLVDKGFYKDALHADGYWQVFKTALS
ncbi:MAG: fatty acid desaturase family protein [Chitinophagales bacterium]|nr:fatty acid desaturase family protein [Bacteroidota bacterium]MCB9255578.1 fatty acid desaturase family protein [Chitinophagales bacterium]